MFDFFLPQVLEFCLAFFPGTICLVFATVWNWNLSFCMVFATFWHGHFAFCMAMFAFHFAWYLSHFGISTSHLHGTSNVHVGLLRVL